MDDLTDSRWEAAQEGAELVREQEFSAAVTELERVLADDGDNEYALFFLGCAHFELGDHERALKAFVLALEKAPDYLGAMVHAGHTLRMLGRHDQALRMGAQVLGRDPKDADALYLMGLIHFSRGDQAEAQIFLQRFLETNPELEVAQEARGMLEVLVGNVVAHDEDDLPN